MIDLAPLRAAAEAVADHHWAASIWFGTDDGGWAAVGPLHIFEDPNADNEPGGDTHARAAADATFIALANPATVLALVAELERQRELVDAAVAYEEAQETAPPRYEHPCVSMGRPCAPCQNLTALRRKRDALMDGAVTARRAALAASRAAEKENGR